MGCFERRHGDVALLSVNLVMIMESPSFAPFYSYLGPVWIACIIDIYLTVPKVISMLVFQEPLHWLPDVVIIISCEEIC